MQKKLLVAAISAALIIPGAALAQKKPRGGDSEAAEPDSVVELYGKVYPELVFPSSAGHATAASATTGTNDPNYCTLCARPTGVDSVVKRIEEQSSNSRFGVRGSEKIGADLRAIFQLETQFLLDQNNTAFAARDSFVGVKSKRMGTIKLGRMDTPFKEFGDDISFMGVSSGNITSTSSVNRIMGFGPQSSAGRFHERRVNAIQYETPELGPFEGKIQWSTNETKTDQNLAATPVVPARDPHVLSMGGKLDFGFVEIMAGHEIHYDLFGLSANSPSSMRNTSDPNVRSRDQATEIALKFKFGPHLLEVDANQMKYREPGAQVAGRVSSYKQNHYLVIWETRWSRQWRTAFHYVKATAGSCERVNAICVTNGAGGQQFAAGVSYNFSPKTYAFLMATLLKNDFAASFNNSDNQSVSPGEDIRQVALGLHTAW